MAHRSIRFNGSEHRITAATLDQLLDEMGFDARRRGIAVALNGQIVPRGSWAVRKLESGDRVEVVGAVQGG